MKKVIGIFKKGLISVLIFTLMLNVVSCGNKLANDKTKTIILGAYTVPKEAYQKIIPAFQKYWEAKTGEKVIFKESYVASGAQARAIIGGFEADVAALSLEGDIDQIAKAGLITGNWKKTKYEGFVTNSLVVIGVREGNPKGINDWSGLLKNGVSVLYPNPKTSGGAMWGVNAIYGAALKNSEMEKGKRDYKYAREFLKAIQGRVEVMDKSGRESFSTFEQGIGDAVITYENEILRAVNEGQRMEIIYPKSTILIENPVAIIDQNVEKHGNREVVEAFIEFLYSVDAQEIFAKAGFRPINQKIQRAFEDSYPVPERLFNIEYLGGWNKVLEKIYGPEGVWTKILVELAKN